MIYFSYLSFPINNVLLRFIPVQHYSILEPAGVFPLKYLQTASYHLIWLHLILTLFPTVCEDTWKRLLNAHEGIERKLNLNGLCPGPGISGRWQNSLFYLMLCKDSQSPVWQNWDVYQVSPQPKGETRGNGFLMVHGDIKHYSVDYKISRMS